VLLNGIYLTAVMDVLAILKDGDGIYEGKRWHTVFAAKIQHLGINITTGDILENSQTLLQSPFTRIQSGEADRLL
jgi:hypothetical protein